MLFISFFVAFCFSKVTQVNPEQLSAVIGKSKYIFVDFYCSSCPFSIATLPVWDKISEIYAKEKRFEFYKIDCDRYYSKCVKFGAQGYPVFGVYTPGMKEFIQYNRDKEADKFVTWVKQYTGISIDL